MWGLVFAFSDFSGKDSVAQTVMLLGYHMAILVDQ